MQNYLIAFVFIFYSTASYANIIIPAFSVIFVANFFVPLLSISILVLETTVLYFSQPAILIGRAIGTVFIANVISTIAGFTIGFFLPSGYGDDVTYRFHVVLGLPIAYLLSIFTESYILYALKNINNPLKCSILMNSASYFFIACLMLFDHFINNN